MGWFKKAFKLDTYLPESVKKTIDPLMPEKDKNASGWGTVKEIVKKAATPTEPGIDPAVLAQQEADNLEQQKRMARLGKYFTSPLGVGANDGANQKIFS